MQNQCKLALSVGDVLSLFCVSGVPSVTVQSSADTVDYNANCILTCLATSAGPSTDYTLYWQFKYKFTDNFQALTAAIQGISTELPVRSASASDAGTYRCNARNLADVVSWADFDIEVNCKLEIEFVIKHCIDFLTC